VSTGMCVSAEYLRRQYVLVVQFCYTQWSCIVQELATRTIWESYVFPILNAAYICFFCFFFLSVCEKEKKNVFQIAGVHLSPNLCNSLLTKDRGEHMRILTRWSDVFIREDLTNSVKDSQSVDSFVTNALDERLSMAKCVAAMGGGGSLTGGSVGSACNFGSALSCLRIASPQFSVSREHAHMILLMSCDVNCYE
ncbi:hypothetical protein OESDEN_00004, partial [Oesophagostomum dentatum]